MKQQCAWETLLDRVDDIRAIPEKNDYSDKGGVALRSLKELQVKFDEAG